jgi:uncharacterized protein YoxC
MTLIDFLLIILIISASALCIALIFYLARITRSFNAMQKDLKEISTNFNPLINSVSELTEKLSIITESAQSQLDVSRSIIYSIKERVDTILELEEKVRSGIEVPLLSIVKNLKAISNGVSTFFSYFRKDN